jgi:hypothetical protein
MSSGTNILTNAFVIGQAEPHPKNIDLRQEAQAVREALKGKQVPVSIWNQHMYDIPGPLLKVTSIRAADFVTKGKIALPDDAPTLEVDPRCVGIFLDYMKSLTQVRNPTPLRLHFDYNEIETHLVVCQAAMVLGMDKYVDHLIRQADAIFHGLPSYEDLDDLVIHKDWYPRVYGIAVRTFARLLREDEIPDPDDFEKYLFQREEFAQDIEEAKVKHYNWIEMQARHEQREQQCLKNENAAQPRLPRWRRWRRSVSLARSSSGLLRTLRTQSCMRPPSRGRLHLVTRATSPAKSALGMSRPTVSSRPRVVRCLNLVPVAGWVPAKYCGVLV